MEHRYGIVVTNRFLIGHDDVADPEDFITETQKERVKRTNQGKGKKQESQPKKQEPESKSRKEDTKDSRPDSKRGRGRGANNADTRPPRKPRDGNRRQEYTESVENQENQAPHELHNDRNDRPPRSSRPPRDRDGERQSRTFGERFSDRPRDGDSGDRPQRGRGRGGFRGRGGGRGKREFDRRSGSDKSSFKPQDKREGGGTHNWGSFKDYAKEADNSNAVDTFTSEEWDAGESKDVKTVPDKKEEDTAAKEEQEEEEVEKEPEVQEMTLDEYKALQASSRPKQDFNLRRPGEGEDSGQWKKTYVLKKTSVLADDEDKEDEHGLRERPKTKDQLDIKFNFYDQPTRGGRGGRRGMGRGGGGGRGRGRGGGGGGGRGGGGRSRGDEAHLSLGDDKEFPSLGN